MNIIQKQRIYVKKIGVLPVFNSFASAPLFFLFGAASSLFPLYVVGFPCLFNPPFFLLLYCGFSTPAVMRKVSYSALNSFLLRYCGPDLRQKTCELKDLYFWRSCRESNFLSKKTDLAIFGRLSAEIRAINRNSLCSAGISGWFNPYFSTRFLGFETTKLSYMPFICFVDLHLSYLKMVTNIRN